MVTFKKIIALSIAMIIFTCLGLGVYLNYHYATTRVEKPQPELERTYPLNVHGTIVYLTKQEDLQLKWLFRVMFIFLIIGAIITYFWGNPFSNN